MKDLHVRIEDDLYNKTKEVYPYYGGLQQAITEALTLWHKGKELQNTKRTESNVKSKA